MKKTLQPVIIIVFIFSFLTTKGQQQDEGKHWPADTAIQLMPKEFFVGWCSYFRQSIPNDQQEIRT